MAYLKCPHSKKITINLGDRQHGRLQAKSIINIDISSKKIIQTIKNFYNGKYNSRLKKLKIFILIKIQAEKYFKF